jgi:hypothetical protein
MHAERLFRCLLVLLTTMMAFTAPITYAASPTAGMWTLTSSMHQVRAFQTATLLPDGLVLVAGGYHGNSALAGAELYHAHTGSWAGTGAMHQPRSQFTASLLRNGQVLAAGGLDTAGNTLAGAELYHPGTGSWTVTGSLHQPRTFQTMTLLRSGLVLIAGGVAHGCPNTLCSGVLAEAELYDPRTGAWAVTGPMLQARARATATLLPSGQVLVAGGSAGGANNADNNSLSSAELYDPQTGKWTATGSMHTARWSATADLLPGDLVLVAGGYSENGAALDAEIYHPQSGTWTVTGSLHIARAYETAEMATLLPSGQVLVAGSYEGRAGDAVGNPGAAAELYSPRTGAWTQIGSMHDPRMGQTATLLSSGQVLVAGGCRTIDCLTVLAGAELYQP